ncbi:SDR family oxidoreductase [Chitinophaga defluvii]|uniref:NAD(P)H-binding protein n=1 Tax=Chitinophaga defluvii TaxID=3163343 RepID=A0ABV2T528_9BACT
MKIVITGSLGHISKLVAQALVQKGHSVTVISSNAQKQEEIEALGAKAAIGSLENVNFLISAFKDADAVYCMIPPNFSELNQVEYYKKIGNNYAQAIQQSGVKRIVHLSSWGAHLDKGTGIILGSHNVETMLNRLQDASITHIRPGSYYYNLLGFISMIKSVDFIGANYGGDDKIVWAHPIDISAAVAEELEKTPTETRKVRYVASDERTASETALVLGNAISKPGLQWLTFTDEQAKKGMEQNGIPASIASDLVDLNASIHSGAMGEDYKLNKPAMGKIKVEDFAKEFADAFYKG